jgi:multiple sugar transport system substrate-binding protein
VSTTRRTKALAVMAALGAALLLAACGGGGGGESSGSEGPVEIEFWHGQTQQTAKEVQAMIDEFNETHPDVKVSKDSGGVNSDRMLQKVTAGLQAGNYPDIAYIYGSDLANLARGTQLVDLTEAVENGEVEWENYVPAAQEAATVEGKPRAVPSFVDNLAVVYNKKIFDEAGVPYPTGEWSWEEFLETAKKVNSDSKGIAGFGWPGTGDEDTTWRIWPLVWQKGGEVIGEDGESVGFEGEPGEAALEVLQKAQEDGTVYIDSTAGSERMQQLFTSGKMAMDIAGPYTLPEDLEAGIEYGVVSLPSFNSEHTTISGPDTWAVFDNGEARVKAALEFLKWFSEPKQQLRWLKASGSLPLTKNVDQAPGFAKYEKATPGLKEYVENTALARTRPTVPTYPVISQAMGKAVAEVLYGKAGPKEALEGAVDTANHELQVGGP